MAHPLPIQSWKLIFPWVVSAVKLGASLLIRNAIGTPPCCDSVVMDLVAERHAEQNAPARRPGKAQFTGRPIQVQFTAYAQLTAARNGSPSARPMAVSFGAERDERRRARRPWRVVTPGERAWAGVAPSPAT